MAMSKQTKQKMREAKLLRPVRYWLGRKRPNMIGDKNPAWAGDRIGYYGLHIWINAHFGKAFKCENIDCIYPRMGDKKRWMIKPKRYHWANVSGKYLRDREDWVMLCVSCHKKYDINKKYK